MEPVNPAPTRDDHFVNLPRTPRSNDRIVSGAAAGWSERWGVEPTAIRAALGLLSLIGGLGLVLYGLAVFTSDPPDRQPTRRLADAPPGHRRELAIACMTGIVLVAARAIGVWPGDAIMVGASAAAVGVSLAWLQPDRRVIAWGRRQRIRKGLQLLAGIALLGAGVGSLANRTGGLSNLGASASAIAVVIGGLAVFGAPAIGRTLRSLDEERSLRIREDELARVSAHLHDSVLQSLVLIQRSDDPRRMTSLARRQERELRGWLYGDTPTGEPTSLSEALAALVTEIEDDHDLRIEAVVVGDQPLDEASRSLVAAVREAVVNAANHAGVDRIDVFVEAEDAELTGFVRDTGRGFDVSAVIDGPGRNGHRGISDSIVGRVERVGGIATIESTPGRGTEVELRVPRVRS